MRAKIPQGRGAWAAFWLLNPNNWPLYGEIDILGKYYKINVNYMDYIVVSCVKDNDKMIKNAMVYIKVYIAYFKLSIVNNNKKSTLKNKNSTN